jgi:hypothetical protein
MGRRERRPCETRTGRMRALAVRLNPKDYLPEAFGEEGSAGRPRGRATPTEGPQRCVPLRLGWSFPQTPVEMNESVMVFTGADRKILVRSLPHHPDRQPLCRALFASRITKEVLIAKRTDRADESPLYWFLRGQRRPRTRASPRPAGGSIPADRIGHHRENRLLRVRRNVSMVPSGCSAWPEGRAAAGRLFLA